VPLTALGLSGELARTFGVDPAKAHLYARVRAEGAFTHRVDSVGASGYGRAVFDGTFSHRLGGLDAALTGATGASTGDLPPQRGFYIGGLQTVRGQFARPAGAGRTGDAFWLGRAEVGPAWLAFRPSVFYDVGWAGPRGDFARPGKPLSGAGVGVSLLEGLLKIEAAQGISPERRWRWDVYLGARF
jgi:hemolysin activation/secretion protein